MISYGKRDTEWDGDRSDADAADESYGDLSDAAHQPAASGSSDLSLSPAPARHHATKSRLGGADITYIPVQRGFVYLCAILDWASRRVLTWRLSNTLTTDFCLEAVREAISRYGTPETFNTDQGCQFTSQEFTGLLKDHGIQISMDGVGCWRDNVFVEQLWLWRSLKYEAVYLHAYESISATQQGLARYLMFYNQIRPYRALDGHTPDSVYFDNLPARHPAA